MKNKKTKNIMNTESIGSPNLANAAFNLYPNEPNNAINKMAPNICLALIVRNSVCPFLDKKRARLEIFV